tara:strand:+ start:16756 stop:17436 length:681 start_codon:yes stop_codon:yes gene_type:complete
LEKSSGNDRFSLTIPDFDFSLGQNIAVTGPSGSGKSTFLELLGLLSAPVHSGQFLYSPHEGDDLDIIGLWRHRALARLAHVRARSIGYVLQTDGLLPYLTIEANINLCARLGGTIDPGFIRNMIDALGLKSLRSRYPAALSVGQRQRAAIARALANKPSLIIADEPTASLDRGNALNVIKILLELSKTMPAALICATHDVNLVDRFGFETFSCQQEGTSRSCLVPA